MIKQGIFNIANIFVSNTRRNQTKCSTTTSENGSFEEKHDEATSMMTLKLASSTDNQIVIARPDLQDKADSSKKVGWEELIPSIPRS